MLTILRNQQYRRLAEGLPPGTDVASKTGGIAGVSNDSGIIYPGGKSPIVAVCLTRDLTPAQMEMAPAAIARIARAAWDAWA
jgi:beta-lactamase class A